MVDKMFDQGVRLAMELGLLLKLELEGVEIPLESTFCGFVDNYIILTPPAQYHQVQHKFFVGSELLIKYFYNGTVYAFQSKLFARIDQPVKLLLIEYPKLVQANELRSEKRSRCLIPAVLKVGDMENNGTIIDIAKSGCHCMVRSKHNKSIIRFKVGEHVLMKCKFPGVKMILEIVGEVKNLQSTKLESNVGILFHNNTTDATQKILTWYLSTIETFSFP